jgi:hypothetical protein
MVAHTCIPSTQETETGDCGFEVSLGYIVRPGLEKEKKIEKWFKWQNTCLGSMRT